MTCKPVTWGYAVNYRSAVSKTGVYQFWYNKEQQFATYR